MTIITSPFKLEIGKSYGPKEFSGLPFANGPNRYEKEYRFMVLKVETLESYIQSIKEMYPDYDSNLFARYDYFYLVSLD